MKSSILLVPLAFLSSALAWGSSSKGGVPNDVQPSLTRRYDYKQSLKKPFQHQGAMPFWGHYGNAFVALEFIRLAPSVPRLRGSVWRSAPNQYKEWEVEFSFKAHGQSPVGGKGMAFWYTEERAKDGPIFGNQDQYKGLGVFLDTSDPAQQRSNSVIYGIVNDGQTPFPSNPTASSFGGCLRDYKNTPTPVVVRVSYVANTLRVSVDTMSGGKKLVTCFEQSNISLPPGYHFGFSGAANEAGASDDHDLYSFEVYEVNPPPKSGKHLRPHEAEMIKKGEEAKVDEKDKETFEEVQKIVQDQEQKQREEEEGIASITAAQMAKAVGETQFRIIESLNNIHNKLETLGAPAQPPASTSQSLEDINHKINTMASSLHAMENVVQGLVDHIMAQGGVKDMPDISKVLKEELQKVNTKMEDMDTRQAFQHRMTQNRLVNSTSWVNYVVFLIVLQVVAVCVYTWYRKRLEMNEKKFI